MPKKTRLSIARQYKKQIAKLDKERDKVYTKAIKELKLVDDDWAFDYFLNDFGGDVFEEKFEERLND